MYRPPTGGGAASGCFFALSVFLNLGLIVVVVLGCMGLMFSGLGGGGDLTAGTLTERVVSGTKADKIAIIQLDGIILEGALTYVHKQIEQAAKDKNVKAIVLRINSPGGSVTASDDLYRKLLELRDGGNTLPDGTKKAKHDPKPLVVSMASLAASGGYYVALPGEYLFAERTTMTGSIGVYASFPNVKELAEKNGVKMNTIKAGDIKDSGSMFSEMSDAERATGLVVKHRPDLKHKPTEKFPYTVTRVPGQTPDKPIPENLQRNIADGGIWTAQEALDLKLIDAIGTLDDAVAEARQRAQLGEDAKVIKYERQRTLSEILLGAEANQPGKAAFGGGLNGAKLGRALTPRLWALMPGADVAGLLAGIDE
jgi:protease-4